MENKEGINLNEIFKNCFEARLREIDSAMAFCPDEELPEAKKMKFEANQIRVLIDEFNNIKNGVFKKEHRRIIIGEL